MELKSLVTTKNRWSTVGKFSVLFIAAAYFFPIVTVFIEIDEVFEEYFVAGLAVIGAISFFTLAFAGYFLHRVFEDIFKRQRVFIEIRKASPDLFRKFYELDCDGADVLGVLLECEEFEMISDYASALEGENRRIRKLVGGLPDTDEGRRRRDKYWDKSEQIQQLPTWKHKEQELLERTTSKLPLEPLHNSDQQEAGETVLQERSPDQGNQAQVA